MFNGPHPETGEELVVEDGPPEGTLPNDLPPQTDVFAPDYAPEDIAEIAQKLRKAAGFDEPTGKVANESDGVMDKLKDVVSDAKGAAKAARLVRAATPGTRGRPAVRVRHLPDVQALRQA